MKIISIILLVLVTLQLIGCGGGEERKEAYLAKADKALESGDLDEARINLKNVLQIDPKDARAYYKLGNVFEQKKNYNKAYGYYNQATQLDPGNSEYQAKLGRFYLLLAGDIDKAKEKMELILSKNKDDVNGLLLKAGINLKEKKISNAQSISEKILKSDPSNIENIVLLTTIYDQEKDYKSAITVLNTAIKNRPGDLQLLNLLANSLFLSNDIDGAEKVLKEVISLHPDDFQNYKVLAHFYLKTERREKAEETLQTAVAANDDDSKRKIFLIQYIKQTKGIDAAIKNTESMIKENSKQSDVRLMLASLEIADNNSASAISIYKRIINDFSEEEAGITARVNLAKLYMQKNDEKTASKYIEDAVKISPNSTNVNFVKAKIAIYNKDYDHAISSLRTVVKNSPDNIEAYILLAASHKANNEPDQAKSVMSNAFENNRDNIKAISELTRFYLQSKNISGAEKVIDSYLKLSPNNYDALSIKAGLLNANKNYSEASTIAKKLISLYPDKDNGYIQATPSLLINKKFDDAIKLLNSGYKATNSNRLLKLVSDIQIRHGDSSKAIETLNSINDKGNDESIQLLLAKGYEEENDYDSAEKVLLASIEQDKTRADSYIALANLYLHEKRSEQCVSILNKGIVANPDNAMLSATLAGYYEKTKDYKNAIDVYESILAITPDNIIVTNNLATLLVDHRSDNASLERAKVLAKKLENSKQPAILDTVGWVYYKAGDFSRAINIFKNVISTMPDVKVFNYHIGMAYYRSGDKVNAKKYLSKAVDNATYYEGINDARDVLKSL